MIKYEVVQEFSDGADGMHKVGDVLDLDSRAERTLALVTNGYIKAVAV